jgi:hypothetical protein
MEGEFILGCLEGACLIVIYLFIKWSLKPETFDKLDSLRFALRKDVGHLAWSDEFNMAARLRSDFDSLNKVYAMKDVLGNPDFPRMELSEVSSVFWNPSLSVSAGTDWLARKLTLWERFRSWLWKLRHFHWRF